MGKRLLEKMVWTLKVEDVMKSKETPQRCHRQSCMRLVALYEQCTKRRDV